MKLTSFIFMMVMFFSILTISVIAPDVLLNLQGTVSGPCSPNANISIYGYCPGQIGNNSCSIDNATWVADNAGGYANVLTYDSAIYPLGIDVLIVADNISCSLTATGSTSELNAVGGGSPVTIDIVMSNPFTLDKPSDGSFVINQTINFSWTNNIVNSNSTIQIDNNSDFSSVDLSQSNILDSNFTFVTTLIDNVYYWRVFTYIGSTLIQQSGVNDFILAKNAPVIVQVIPSSSTWISSNSIMLNVTTNVPSTCSYSTSSGVSYDLKQLFSNTGSTTDHRTTVSLPANGVNDFYVECNGSNGNLMPVESHIEIFRDTLIPDESSAVVQINSGDSFTTNTSINISWSGFTDSVSSIQGYYISLMDNAGTTSGVFTSGTSLILSGMSEGTVTVYVWAVDEAGNIGSAISDSIIVDTLAPSFSSWSTSPINLNQFTTVDVVVYVTINDFSDLSSIPQLKYKIGSDVFSTSEDMSLIGGSVYSFIIPNKVAPNDWANRAGENLTYVVNAIDERGFSSSGNYSTYINDQFTAPTFLPLNSFSEDEGNNISIALKGFDIDGDTLVFTSNNSNIIISSINSSNSVAYWTPTNSDVGSNILFFTVTDGHFNISQAVIANIININDDPVFESLTKLSAYEYESFAYSLNASDIDGDSLFYSTNTSLFVISRSGTISFTPTASQRGSNDVEFTVQDGNGGQDTINITFEVLFCGDSICSSTFESSDTCSSDCIVEESSQGFIIDSKTCLGDILNIKAVELVSRASCPTKGIIINGWESCENISDTLIHIEQDIHNMYVQVTSLLTDEFGVASFTPNETGDYRIRYDNSDFDENMVYFGINICSKKDVPVEIGSEDLADLDNNVKLPLFEEPLTQEQIIKLSKTTKVLYFVLLPFLFILMGVAAISTYYRYDKQKGSGNFSTDLDAILKKINLQLSSITKKVLSSKTYQQMKPYFAILEGQLLNTKQAVMKSINPLVKIKNISVPFYASKLGHFSENKLLLQSLYGFHYKNKKSVNFTQALLREELLPNNNLRLFSLNAHKLGIPLTYLFSATKNKDELLSLHNVMSVKKSYPTFSDIKMELLKGNVVVIPLHMNTLNKAAPNINFLAILTGYNETGFFMLDYSFSRKKKTFVPLKNLRRSWNATGYLECVILKK